MPWVSLRALAFITALFAALALLAVPGAAAAKQGKGSFVIAPKPGAQIGKTAVKVVVRSGPNWGDLGAALNGKRIGRDFRVGRKGPRYLWVTASHGLRHGRNVLKVTVRRGTARRHKTVVFTVTNRLPLTGAGRDRRVTAGGRIRLHGRVALHSTDSKLKSARWKLVSAPRASRLGRGTPASARARVQALHRALRGAASLTPTFRPDVPGRYTLKLVGRSANGASGDTTTIFAVPPSQLVPVDTEVPGTPASPPPGIRVGGTLYQAQWLASASNRGTYSGRIGNLGYEALWQVLILDRKTLAPVSNRTYGLCREESSQQEYICRNVPGGLPKETEDGELERFGPERLVIASSHPASSESGRSWGPPDAHAFLTWEFDGLGAPEPGTPGAEEISRATPGAASLIGVPGMPEGAAKFTAAPDGKGMIGYLTPSDLAAQPSYGFVFSQRADFDTRSPSQCAASGCTVTQKVGEISSSETVLESAGYLVSTYDRHSFARDAVAFFATNPAAAANRNPILESEAMAAFIEKWRNAGALIMVTSAHAANQPEPGLVRDTVLFEKWNPLVEAIASIGGTRNNFNVAASNATPTDYTLVGWAGLEEGEGEEAIGSARLQGTFGPGNEGKFEAIQASAGAPPANQLEEIVLRPPSTDWGLSAAEERAFSWIGGQVPQLGPTPRQAYLENLNAEFAIIVKAKVEKVGFPQGATPQFGKVEFEHAKVELISELEDVAAVRAYLKLLAEPAKVSGQGAFQEAFSLQTELEKNLEGLREKSKIQFEFLTFIEAFFEVAGIPDWAWGKFAQAAGVAVMLAQSLYSYQYSGAPEGGGMIYSDELAKQLQEKSTATVKGLEHLGDIIVSDPEKLRKVGKNAKCQPNGCEPGYEDLAYTQPMAETAEAVTVRARDRTIYEKLMPKAFPIWRTGLTGAPSVEEFDCDDSHNPFYGAPKRSYFFSLDAWDPERALSKARPYISVTRSYSTYGWASEAMLNRMFNPVATSSFEGQAGGLEMDPLQFMLNGIKEARYRPSPFCHWPNQTIEEIEEEEARPPKG